MFTKEETDQMIRESIVDSLIDDDQYFQMTDPNPFLDWAVNNTWNWTDMDVEGDLVVDYLGMLREWFSGNVAEAA